MTIFELDLYYAVTISYTKFEVNISKKNAEKSPENLILAKDNNSYKSRSSVTKLELDLYYVMANSYIKCEVNISIDSREKSGKLKCDRLTDGRTDGRTDGLTDWRTDGRTDSEQN